VLDAYSLSPTFEVTDHFSGEVLVQLPAHGGVFTALHEKPTGPLILPGFGF